MEKTFNKRKIKKTCFYDPKGRRNIAFISFLCISIVSVGVVFYFSFKVFFNTEIPNMNTAVQQDTKLVPINQKLSDQQLKKKEFNPNTETKDNKIW